MLLSHLGMVEGPAGEPRSSLGMANGLTLLRAWLVPALALLTAEPFAFAIVFALGAVADGLDGPLSRRRGEVTRLGHQADAAVDVAFALTAAWSAAAAGWLPAWAAPAVTARYLLPPVLIAGFYFARAAAPSRRAIVRGRYPGIVVACALGLATIPDARSLAVVLLAIGLAGGGMTFGASFWRLSRSRAPTLTAKDRVAFVRRGR